MCGGSSDIEKTTISSVFDTVVSLHLWIVTKICFPYHESLSKLINF